MNWFSKAEIVTDWQWLDSSVVEPRSETTREGSVLTIRMTSPYELPEAVRARHVDDTLFIEFKYLEDERTVRRQQSNELYLHLGKYTGRVYRLEFDLRSLKAGDTRKAFEKIRDLTPPSQLRSRRKDNYQAIRRIVDLKGLQLASAVGA